MDQPQSDKEPSNAMHVVIDEVRAPRARMRAGHPERWPGLVALGAILFGLSAFAFSGWVYVEGQREIVRLSTELAQLKVSLDLYVRNGGGSADLTDLTERLTELEQAARSNAVPMPSAPANAAEGHQGRLRLFRDDQDPAGVGRVRKAVHLQSLGHRSARCRRHMSTVVAQRRAD